jgi:hypothetical protein
MAKFYFNVQTMAGVEHDTSGVDVAHPMTALNECMDVIAGVIAGNEFIELTGVTIEDEHHHVIATINIEAIRHSARLASNGKSSADD